MPKKPAYRVPFDERGVLMHYASAEGCGHLYDAAHEWRDPEPVTMTLAVHGLSRGRSAAYFLWIDEHFREWPVFMKEMLEIVRTATIINGTVRGAWIPCKRGNNYGLKYLGPDEGGAFP